MSQLEAMLEQQLKTIGETDYVREYRFAAEQVGMGKGIRERLNSAGLKDWRFDFAWPEIRFAVEVEGGEWVGGRHGRGGGITADCEKYGEAMDNGWNIYRCTGQIVKSGRALSIIENLLARSRLGS